MAFASGVSGPISESPKRGALGTAIFGSIFALFGFGFLFPVFLLPVVRTTQAQGWREVPCTILHSELVSHSGSKGSTYNIKVAFAYKFAETRYVGTRYDFSVGSSSGREYRLAIVRRLHSDARTICYVNPTRPSEAVLDRGLNRDLWFACIPLIFVAVGVGIVVSGVRRAHPKPISSTRKTLLLGASADAVRPSPHGKQIALRPAHSPFAQLIGIGAFSLFWNGIISIFVYKAYFDTSRGADRFEQIFCIPFAVVGIGLIVLWFYQLLSLFNPRPQIVLADDAVSLGKSTELRWTFTGNYARINRLTIYMQGREEATYQRGTTTTTDRNIFASIRVADTTRQADIGSGRGIFSIPSDTMHSFAAPRNKIIWSIIVHGEISGWPDAKAEFPIHVAPQLPKKVNA